ncbi:hypothetical protein KFL_012050020 [Klebsormidium nitens]|uniref:Integrase catalytic domain-containing protein n=1 Tax=Klebsormidium nitens TaxID=105231 RepID=A0A1Y1IPS5_KLENI|nr:hypothetical protein KFL_012050020 [Klebsormidium nitens]|eukprot:GAQ92925.1 hypothetical protein KFL_012050020 [Klebsormidium nitens]
MVHDQRYYLPKDEGGGGSDSVVAYAAQRKGNKEKATARMKTGARGLRATIVESWVDAGAFHGGQYFATFLDGYNKLSVVVSMKQKSDVAKVTEHVINRLELQLNKKLKSVRTHWEKQYVNKVLKYVFGGKRTVHEKTTPYTAEQNGSAERLNRHVEKKLWAIIGCSRTRAA